MRLAVGRMPFRSRICSTKVLFILQMICVQNYNEYSESPRESINLSCAPIPMYAAEEHRDTDCQRCQEYTLQQPEPCVLREEGEER